ncbi:MAG: pyridoxal-phosphate-dependent aminotransferase family protein [Candidatus Bathyarchaeia archaeon]
MVDERELLMIPGPTMVSPRVLRVMAKPVLSHVSQEFVDGFAEALELQKWLFGTDGIPFMLSGSGTLGMEAAMANLIERGERVLCVENGYFGEKWEEIVRAHGGEVDRLRFDWGEVVDVDLLAERLESDDYKAFTVEHVDTSTGIANPIDEIGELAKDTGALYIVDSVCGIGGMPLKMDEWNIDYCLTGSQKAVGAPPGISLFCLNERTWSVVEDRESPIDDYYTNLRRWKPIMDNPKGYFATPAVGMVLGMREALRIIKEEGLEARWRRHEMFSKAFQAGIKGLSLESFPVDGHEAHTLTVPKVEEIDDERMRKLMREKYGIIIAGGLGKLSGKTVRIGHMGSGTINDVIATLASMEMSLKEMGVIEEAGEGISEAMDVISTY